MAAWGRLIAMHVHMLSKGLGVDLCSGHSLYDADRVAALAGTNLWSTQPQPPPRPGQHLAALAQASPETGGAGGLASPAITAISI